MLQNLQNFEYLCPSLVKIFAGQEAYCAALRKKAANISDLLKFVCLWKILFWVVECLNLKKIGKENVWLLPMSGQKGADIRLNFD